jgi:hypothetical protein
MGRSLVWQSAEPGGEAVHAGAADTAGSSCNTQRVDQGSRSDLELPGPCSDPPELGQRELERVQYFRLNVCQRTGKGHQCTPVKWEAFQLPFGAL